MEPGEAMASQQPTQPKPSPINGLPPPVEHQFQPGKSGNPGGLSKKRRISQAMERLLDLKPDELATHQPKTVAEKLALDILLNAASDARFTTHLLDRTEGKVPDEHRLSGGPQALQIVLAEAVPPALQGVGAKEGTDGSEAVSE